MLLWWPARAGAGSRQGREGGPLAGSCSSWKRMPSEGPGWQWCSLLPPTGHRKVRLLRLFMKRDCNQNNFCSVLVASRMYFGLSVWWQPPVAVHQTLHNLTWRLTVSNKRIRVRPSSQSHLGAIRIPCSLHQEVRTHFLSAGGEIGWCNFVVCGNLKTLASWPAPESLPKAFTQSSSTLSNSKWNTWCTLLKKRWY